MKETITLRIDSELKAWITSEARAQNRTINNFIETVLMEARELDPLLDSMRDGR